MEPLWHAGARIDSRHVSQRARPPAHLDRRPSEAAPTDHTRAMTLISISSSGITRPATWTIVCDTGRPVPVDLAAQGEHLATLRHGVRDIRHEPHLINGVLHRRAELAQDRADQAVNLMRLTDQVPRRDDGSTRVDADLSRERDQVTRANAVGDEPREGPLPDFLLFDCHAVSCSESAHEESSVNRAAYHVSRNCARPRRNGSDSGTDRIPCTIQRRVSDGSITSSRP